jgi:hypothetical protein
MLSRQNLKEQASQIQKLSAQLATGSAANGPQQSVGGPEKRVWQKEIRHQPSASFVATDSTSATKLAGPGQKPAGDLSSAC